MLSLTENDKRRYWAKVEVKGLNECWPWTASKNWKGYGQFSIGRHVNVGAHRVGLAIRLGSIPDGIHALHSCDIRCCQNPCHVFPGTNLENIADKISKGRQKVGEQCKNSKLTQGHVESIRTEYLSGGVSHLKLSEKYKISKCEITRILHRKIWKHAA